MALISCPECKREVSENSPSCPHCGQPYPAKRDACNPEDSVYSDMRKKETNSLFGFGILFMVLLVIAGIVLLCANSAESKRQPISLADEPSVIVESEKQEPDTSAISSDGTVSITTAIDSAKETRNTSSHRALGSSIFVWVYASTTNNGDGIVHSNPNDWTLQNPDGETVSPYIDTYALGNYFDAVDLRPGGHADGWLIFCITKADRYYLNYHGFGGSAQVLVKIPKPKSSVHPHRKKRRG